MARVRVTQNFTRNLDEIRGFLDQHAASGAFDELLDQILDVLIPNLKRFPRLGVDFGARPAASVETQALKRQLLSLAKKPTEIREYMSGDYIILYALRGPAIHLLSIRHHRQLSFDLKGHWEWPPK